MRSVTLRIVLALVLVAAGATAVVRAQMQHQHQGAQMQGQASSSMMASTEQMMRNIDTMMTNAASAMKDLTTMMSGQQHDLVMASMEGMLAQMRQFRGDMNDMMKDPMLAQSNDAMKSFQQAGQNLKDMTAAFEKMTKNMTAAMKGMSHDAKK